MAGEEISATSDIATVTPGPSHVLAHSCPQTELDHVWKAQQNPSTSLHPNSKKTPLVQGFLIFFGLDKNSDFYAFLQES